MAISINGDGNTTGPYYERTSDLPDYNSTYTVCMWFRPGVVGTQWNGLFHLFYNSASSGDLFEIDDGVGNSVVYVSVNNVSARGSTALSADTWYHLAMVRESSTSLKGYLNGVLEATNTTNAGTRTAPNKMGTGWWDGSAWSDRANGRLFNYQIFNRALTAEEIKAQMNRILPITQDTYAWWPLWSTADDEVDYSGNGRNWSVSGTPADADGPPVTYGAPVFFSPLPVWTPLLISGCQLWLDASDSGSITSDVNGVSQWNDKSGNARHATQSTNANKPAVQTNAFGSLSSVRFTTSNYMLTGNNYAVAQSTAMTIAVVVKPTATPSTWAHVMKRNTSVSGQMQVVLSAWYGQSGYVISAGKHAQSSVEARGGAASSGVGKLLVATLTGSYTASLYEDGSESPATVNYSTQNGSSATVAWYLGDAFAADYAEVIIYNSVLSSTDRDAVEAYLQAKWMPTLMQGRMAYVDTVKHMQRRVFGLR